MTELSQFEWGPRDLAEVLRLHRAICGAGCDLPADADMSGTVDYIQLLQIGMDLRKRTTAMVFAELCDQLVAEGAKHLDHLWAGLRHWPDMTPMATRVTAVPFARGR